MSEITSLPAGRYSSFSLLSSVSVLLAFGLSLSCCSDGQKVEDASFPPGFLWGTATAGFQVDMGCPTLPADECEDRGSDWYQWVTDPDLIADGSTYLSGDPVSRGPGHYELFEEDFDGIVSDLSNNAFRMSLEWSRIFPESTIGVDEPEQVAGLADPVAVAHYHDVFAALKARSITPLVTINHYTLPLWIHDGKACHQDIESCQPAGWQDPDLLIPEMVKYAAFVADEFGGEVDLWATLNEPFAVIMAGFLSPTQDRTNPPGVGLKFDETRKAIMAMVEAHARVFDALKAHDVEGADGDEDPCRVGIVYAIAPVRPADPEDEVDVVGAANVDYLYNRAFLNAVVLGDLDENLDGQTVHRQDLAGRMDFLGINYYTRITVEGTTGPTLPRLSPLTTFNPFTMEMWEDYPKGIYDVLMLGASYQLPLYITENGKYLDAGYGFDPPEFLVRHLIWVRRAVRDGADVRGYFYWSLMDNFEWNHGMGMRFGLYGVDPEDSQKTRVLRPAAELYRRIASENRIPKDLAEAYPEPE